MVGRVSGPLCDPSWARTGPSGVSCEVSVGASSVGSHRLDSGSHVAVDNLLTLLTCFLICEMGSSHQFKEHHSWRCGLRPWRSGALPRCSRAPSTPIPCDLCRFLLRRQRDREEPAGNQSACAAGALGSGLLHRVECAGGFGEGTGQRPGRVLDSSNTQVLT